MLAKLAKIIEEYNFLVHFYSNFTLSCQCPRSIVQARNAGSVIVFLAIKLFLTAYPPFSTAYT